MKIEQEHSTEVQVSKNTGIVNVETTLIKKRRSLSFTTQDAEIEKDNLLFRELGKTILSVTAFSSAGIYGLNEIVNGFNNTSIREMENGAIVVLLATLIVPMSKHFFSEARIARAEKNAIKFNQSKI